MFGLYYALVGLLSGAVCSLIAYKKSRNQKDWFTLGQVVPILSVVILLFLTSKGENKVPNQYYQNTASANPILETLS